jgi:two-component system, chemotaxis family, chemotaxis protein CheY
MEIFRLFGLNRHFTRHRKGNANPDHRGLAPHPPNVRARVLRQEHELVEAEDGRKALAALAASKQRFDVILLDLRMPDMNGVEFVQAVRRGTLFRDVPIVVTTAEPESSPLLQDARGLGVAAIVKKPWKPQDLVGIVQTALRPHAGKPKPRRGSE